MDYFQHCQDPINDSGRTLLHYVVDKRDLNAITEILGLCPESSETVDNEEQNFLHLAATLELESIVRNVLALLNVSEKTLNHQDKNGDTPLHIATFSKSEGLAKVLLYDARVKIDIRNKKGKSALDAITFDYDKRRARYGFTSRADEKELKNQSDFDLLVGALICTVSFTAGITVPGGFHSDGPNKGTAMLYKKTSFMTFILSNTFAFVLSLYAVLSHYCTRHVGDEKYTIRQFRLASFCTLGSIFALVVAFISGSFAVLNVSQTLTISICVICGFFFMFACEPMGRMIWEQIQRSRTNE